MKKEDIVLIITFTIALVLLLWFLFGNSPTIDQLILGVTLLNIGWIQYLSKEFHSHLGEHREYRKAKANNKK